MKKIHIIIFILLLSSVGCESLLNSFNEVKNDFNNTVDGVKNGDVKNNVNSTVDNAVDNVKNTSIDNPFNNLNVDISPLIDKAKTTLENSYNVTDFHYAISYGDNSSLYETQENYKNLKSFSYYLLAKDAPPVIEARNSNSAGEVFFVSNKFEAAEHSFKKAIDIYKSLNYLDSTEAILTLSNLGLLYQTMGQYSLAEDYSLQALEHRNNNPKDTTGYAATLNNLGVLCKLQGNFSQSEEYLNKAADFIKNVLGENNMQYAIVLNNKAMLYQIINKTDDAEDLLWQALNIVKANSSEKSATYVRMKINLALLYQSKKVYSEAEAIFLEAIDIKKKRLGQNHPDYATLLRNLAGLYMEMGKYDQVEDLLLEAKVIYLNKFGEDNPQYAKTNFQLGVYYQAIGNYTQADNFLRMALETQKNILPEHHSDITQTYEYLAVNYWHKNMNQNALDNFELALDGYMFQVNNYFEAMSDAEKTKFWNQIYPSFLRFYTFAAQNCNQIPQITEVAYNYYIQTKALLLNDSRKVKNLILSSNNPDLIAKYNHWIDLKNYTVKLFALNSSELADRHINLDSIVDVTDNLEKELATLSADFQSAGNSKIINLSDIKSQLNNDEAVVEIIRMNNYDFYNQTDSVFYMAMIVRSNFTYPEIVVLKNGNKMEDVYIKKYQASVKSGTEMSNYYDYYWADIDAKLSGVKNIYLSVDGIYNRLNVNTFVFDDGTYLIDKYSIYYLTNSKDLLSLKQHLQTFHNIYAKTATLIGFPNYGKGLSFSYIPPLPGTKVEINNIKALLATKNWIITEFMGDDATETALKQVNSPYVLHIATHGYFVERDATSTSSSRSFGIEPERALNNPLLRTGILLAGADKTILDFNDIDDIEIDDGVLNAYEAMIMNLDKTQLVVLSACQTGLGDIKTGEGVYGLQRAFQIAGTQTIITSLWEVSDEGTQELMSEFYKNWLQSGDEYDAFRKARLYIKDKYVYPYYWGAFVLVGK